MRRRALLSLPFARLVAGVAGSAIADDGWKLEKDADGIRIESRAAPGWSIHEMSGTARIVAQLSAVAAVIDDVPAITKPNDVVPKPDATLRHSAPTYRDSPAVSIPRPRSHPSIDNPRYISADTATTIDTINQTA